MGNQKQAVVVNGHTLGVVLRDEDGRAHIQVLRSSVLRGAPSTIEPGVINADANDLRPATKADFDDFRVMWHPDYLVSDHIE